LGTSEDQPDYQGIAAELLGAKRMALAFGNEEAVQLIDRLHREVMDAWGSTADDDRPDAAVEAALAEHGAEVVHQAARAQLEGDGGAALLRVGIEPATARDC